MAFDPGAIDSTLAAAVGDDPALIAELRVAFVESVERSVAALSASGEATEWRDRAARLKSLAASFGAVRLMALAEEAASRPLDRTVLVRIQRVVARL